MYLQILKVRDIGRNRQTEPRNRAPYFGLGLFCLFYFYFVEISSANQAKASGTPQWDQWVQNKTEAEAVPVVQNRVVAKENRFQIMGPFLGISERKDFFNCYFVGLGARYFFSEIHAWEIVRLYWTFPVETGLATEIREQTSFQPDAQKSRFQLGTSYVFAPIYGKYSWGDRTLVHFDIYGTLGGGMRFAKDNQLYLEAGVGMSNYLISSSTSIIPEVRFRIYREQRTQPTTVFETIVQLGISWLL